MYLTSYDTRIDPVAAPQVGDLVFLALLETCTSDSMGSTTKVRTS